MLKNKANVCVFLYKPNLITTYQLTSYNKKCFLLERLQQWWCLSLLFLLQHEATYYLRCCFWMLKANYYIELMSSFVINLAKFWKAVNINKNKSFIPIPSHVTFNDCLINKTSGICHALNTHFATVGNLLDIVTQALNNKPLAHVPLSSPYRPSLRLRLRRHFKLSIAGKQLERIN